MEERTVETAMDSCVRGHHVYKEIWEAAAGKRLISEKEPENQRDRNAVAIKNNGKILGLVPKKCQKYVRSFSKRCINTGSVRALTSLLLTPS